MAPNQQGNLYIEGINIKKRLSAVKTSADIVSVRDQYFKWYADLHELVKNTPFVLKFARIDETFADFANHGGVGISINSERAACVMNLLRKDLDTTLDFLENNQLPLQAMYDFSSKTVSLGDKKIRITDRAESRETELLSVVFSDTTKKWAMDEISEKFSTEDTKNVYYNAARKVNDKVSRIIPSLKLLEVNTKEVWINPDYL